MNAKLLLGLLLLVSIYSCERGRLSRDIIASQDFALAEHAFADIFRQVHKFSAMNASDLKTANVDTCGHAIIQTTPVFEFPKSLIINYGEANCVDPFGARRRGSINAVYSGPYLQQGTIAAVTPQNYYYENHLVRGTFNITHQGLNAAGNQVFRIVSNNTSVVTPAQQEITFNFQQDIEWVEGRADTDFVWNDVFHITGTASGRNREDRIFDASITSPLRMHFSCRWIMSGTVSVIPDQLDERTLNFDVDERNQCNNQAIVNTGARNIPIALR